MVTLQLQAWEQTEKDRLSNGTRLAPVRSLLNATTLPIKHTHTHTDIAVHTVFVHRGKVIRPCQGYIAVRFNLKMPTHISHI